MLALLPLLGALLGLLGQVHARYATPLTAAQAVNATKACAAIAKSISSKSSVYYPRAFYNDSRTTQTFSLTRFDAVTSPVQYANDIIHYGSNNALPSICSIEPGTTSDVSIIVRRRSHKVHKVMALADKSAARSSPSAITLCLSVSRVRILRA